MNKPIVGVSGFAGTGKDTVADILVSSHGFKKISFADPLKKICKDIYDFSDEQLWGPSDLRSIADTRYLRPAHEWKNGSCACCGYRLSVVYGDCYLTPRYALQMLGTEWGRHCYPDTWAEYAVRSAHALLELDARCAGVVIPDVRFKNEVKVLGAHTLVRIKRTGYERPRWAHVSETEQLEIPDEKFHYILENKGSLGDLEQLVHEMCGTLL
jgi:hypothetical protein